MSNVQSYNALIDRFKAFASGHFILKTFSHGQIDTADLEKFTEYPFMHVVPSNVTYAKGMKTFSFQIVLADLPRDKDDKVEFQREVLSDLQRIAEDLVAEITNHRVLFGDLITVQNVSLEPFLEEFHNTLTGWTVSLDLLVPYYWDACSIPAEWNDMFESGSGGTGSILTFVDSITRDEYGNVSLVNDEAEPSPNYYYGTNDEGVRGWYLTTDNVGLTCATIGSCQTIIDIEAAIDDLQTEILLKANTADISAVGFSNDYNDLDNKPTIPAAQVNSDWNATSGVAEILNKPTIPTATSDLTNDGEDGVNPFITAQDLPDTSGFVPYTGATQNVDLGTHTLSAKDLVINHSSGSGVAASITKGGAGEALTVNKTSGSGNAMSVTGGVTQLSELHLTTDLADAYIASAATWNAKVPETRTLTINGTTQDLSANRTFTIATGLTVGTTPITSGTVGRVLFEGTGNVLQESANLFWDNTNSRLGIGTATPSFIIDVVGADARINTIRIGLGGGNVADNTALGASALNLNTSGSGNTAISYFALAANITGSNNTAVGSYCLRNSTQSNNTAMGYSSFLNLSTGTLNIALGRQAARYIADGSTSLTIANQSIFIGADTKALADSQTNQIVIGYNAIGLGSNSVVLGNSSITLTALRGNVLIGTTTDAGFKLDVNGTARVSGNFTAGNLQNSLALDGTGVKFPTVDAVNNLSIIDKYKRGIQYFTDFEGTASVTPYFASFSVGGSVNRLVISVPNATNNQIGIAQYQTGTTATGYFTHISEGFFGRQFFFGGGSWVFETFVCVETLSDAANRFRFVSGFGDQATNTSEGNGVFFTYDEGGIQNGTIASPNWQCVTSVASVRTLTTTTTSVTAGAWTRLRIEVNAAGTSVSFFINGTLAATHTTNIPTWISPSNTRGFDVKQSILKSIGTTNRSVFCDYLGYENRLTTPRT